jgi:hypothetical protein
MIARKDRPNLWKEPGVAYYATICLIALGVIMLVMLQRTYWLMSLLPILAGVGAGFTSFGPYLLVIVIAVCLNAMPFAEGSTFRQTVLDFILCGAVLAYVAGHYRLQSLFVQVFPTDPRRRKDVTLDSQGGAVLFRKFRVIRQRRAARGVTAPEIQRFLMTLPFWVVLAVILWRVLLGGSGNPGLKPHIWRAVMLAWLMGVTGYVAASAIRYWQRRSMDPAEATMYLQDQLWAETRREQRRLNRWLAWARRRPPRSENKS